MVTLGVGVRVSVPVLIVRMVQWDSVFVNSLASPPEP